MSKQNRKARRTAEKHAREHRLRMMEQEERIKTKLVRSKGVDIAVRDITRINVALMYVALNEVFQMGGKRLHRLHDQYMTELEQFYITKQEVDLEYAEAKLQARVEGIFGEPVTFDLLKEGLFR